MVQSFKFQAESPEEITEKVAAIMEGIVKATDSGIMDSLEKKGAMKPTTEFLFKIGKLGLTIEEVEFLCDGMKKGVKISTIFGSK